MNILLVNPPCRVPALIPLGMGYIASVLREEGHNILPIDLNVENRSFSDLEKEIDRLDCDIVGIGGLTTTYNFVKNFCTLVKKIKPEAKTIVGNMVSTANPELLLENSQADICVIDEGEETVRELVARIKNFPDLDNIKGIVFKKGNKVIATGPRERINNLDNLPFPAWDLFSMETYINNPIHREYGKRSINVSTVRGCPFQCIYCSRPFGSQVYMRSPASVISEIRQLKRRYRIEYVAFSDDLFMVNKKWVENICDNFIKEKIDISWGTSARVNLVDLDLLKKMKKAGCEALGYGFESGSQKILDNMKKGVKVEQARHAIDITRKAGIEIIGSFMIGMIGETEKTVNETIDFIREMRLPLHRLLYTTPYPKTSLYEIAKKMNRIPQDEDAYVSSLGEMYDTFSVNLTDMTDVKLMGLKERAEKKIKENFSLSTRIEILSEESRRISANIKKRIKKEGVPATLNWLLCKTMERIAH